MYRKLQDPPAGVPLCLELPGSKVDRWGEAGSPTEAPPHQLSFLPTAGRLLKSESEDSGVEMASSDHSPPTPVGSEKSFSLDCLDDFQPSIEEAIPASHQRIPEEKKEKETPDPFQDYTCHHNLSVSKKLAQVVQRSQRNCLRGQSPLPPGQWTHSMVDSERMKSYHLPPLASVEGIVDVVDGVGDHSPFGCSTPEESRPEEQVPEEPTFVMPGQGLRYLEHICQMLEKIAHLQKVNQRLQHQQKVMECRIRGQKLEKEGFSEETVEVGSGLARVGPQPENPASSEMKEEPAGEADSPGSRLPHHFRARSASDTRVLRSPAQNQGNKAGCSRKSAAHSASSPSLLDQLDGGSQTLPPGMKIKSDHSHWGKVRVLINRIKRRSLLGSEPGSTGRPVPSNSRQIGTDTVFDKQDSNSRRRFLPALGAKKRHSKHLSIR